MATIKRITIDIPLEKVRTHVKKIGNSYYILVPGQKAKELKLKDGCEIEIIVVMTQCQGE